MPSQLGNCNCCKCDDCKCKVVLYKCGGFWAPAPTVKCGRNSVSGRFVFENSADCGGCKCCVQEGCTISKICLDKTYVFRFRVYGHLEKSRGGMHIGEIFYRKICCNGKKKGWKRVVHVAFKANSVDGLDHCGNFLQYDVKWCKNVIGKNCCPSLPDMESVSDFCCSISTNPCCPPPECVPSSKCDECPEDPCTANGWIIIPCSEINLA